VSADRRKLALEKRQLQVLNVPKKETLTELKFCLFSKFYCSFLFVLFFS
jgi:hypothetical protein